MNTHDRGVTLFEFQTLVNMTSAEIENRISGLHTTSIDRRLGKRIQELQQKELLQLDEHDLSHMRSVVHFLRRHLSQCPENPFEKSAWENTLKNWGHHPNRSSISSQQRSA